MTPQEKRAASVAAFLERAVAERAAAQASPLDQVRQKHERAAARWDELATTVARDGAVLDARQANAPPRRRAAPQLSQAPQEAPSADGGLDETQPMGAHDITTSFTF